MVQENASLPVGPIMKSQSSRGTTSRNYIHEQILYIRNRRRTQGGHESDDQVVQSGGALEMEPGKLEADRSEPRAGDPARAIELGAGWGQRASGLLDGV
jgi:hypothetical protein